MYVRRRCWHGLLLLFTLGFAATSAIALAAVFLCIA